MRLYFRPLPGLTAAFAVFFVLLVGLGVWQVQRLHWKLALIATVNRNLVAPPLSETEALARGPEGAQYHRVSLEGRFENDKEAYVFTTDKTGAPVYHVITPFVTSAGTFLVDRGLIPQSLKNPATRPAGEISGETRVVGVWRIPDSPGWFTPNHDRANRVWYARDLKGIAHADGVRLAAPVLIEADATPNPGGWPKGGQTTVTFYNEHLQYAITWFALAAGLVGVYLAYHVSRGRLGTTPHETSASGTH